MSFFSKILTALGLALAFGIAAQPAAALPPGTGFQMQPDGVHVPMIEVSTGVEVASSEEAAVQVLLGFEYRGVEGVKEGTYWARVYVEGGMDVIDGSVGSFRVEFTPYRAIGESNPVPISWETRLFNTVIAHDERTGQDLDGTIKLFGFRGGLFLPASDPGDFEAMIVVALEALGGHIRQFAEHELETFYGAYVAGASLEATFGWQLNEDFKITGTFGVGGDLSMGSSGGDFTALVDSEMHLNFVLSWRNMIDFIIGGSLENYADTGNDRSVGVAKFLASLRFRF
ncbi:MAG: hypothetical protein IT285_03045 [Bdellovibrionales bacterium]|nr:hypothetical protein [Bdellovibrionales bacterium]